MGMDLHALGSHGLRELRGLGYFERAELVQLGLVHLDDNGCFPDEFRLLGLEAGMAADALSLTLRGDELELVAF